MSYVIPKGAPSGGHIKREFLPPLDSSRDIAHAWRSGRTMRARLAILVLMRRDSRTTDGRVVKRANRAAFIGMLAVIAMTTRCAIDDRPLLGSDGPSDGAAGASGSHGNGGATGNGGSAGSGGPIGSGGAAGVRDAGAAGSSTQPDAATSGDGGALSNCPTLAAPAGGTVVSGGLTPGSTARYSCFVGYGLTGVDTLVCGTNGRWDNAPPACSIKDCGPLPPPAQGTVSAPSTTYGSVATYACPVGYGTVPGSTRTCQANGTWSGTAPTCVIANCPALAAPAGGTVSAQTLTFGSNATYACSTGYAISGDSTRTCQPDGSWSGAAPTCTVKNCGALTSPTNGTVSIPSTTYGATATYACSTGYTLSGSVTRTCQDTATWSGTAPTCSIVNCGGLTSPTNGSVSAPTLTYGSQATYGCSTGYALSGASTRTCLQDGSWSGAAPTCSIVNCGALTNPPNGTVSTSSTTYGATAVYGCSTGYTGSGSLTRTCQDTGTWSGTAPTCSIVNCGGLTNPTNGSVSAPSTTYGSTATYSCSASFGLSGSATRTCQASGSWSGTAPMCLSTANCNFKVLSDTLALWPFDDGSGQTVRDIGPNALNGTLGATTSVETADPTWTSPGRFAASGLATQSAQQQYVHVGSAVPFPSNAFTFEAWVRPTGTNYAQFFTAGFINLFVALMDNGAGVEWGVGDGMNWQFHTVYASVSLGTWHYVAVTYNGATMNAYLDGSPIGSKAAAITVGAPYDYNLGGRPYNTFLTGTLGPERLSSTVHSAPTIATTWTNASACPAP
jgi:hypothetical protein